jgi:hypothetical protein
MAAMNVSRIWFAAAVTVAALAFAAPAQAKKAAPKKPPPAAAVQKPPEAKPEDKRPPADPRAAAAADAAPSAGGGSVIDPSARRGMARIEFDDRLIQGQTNKANAIYLFERRESALRSLLKKRTDFRDEIDETLEQ